MSVSRDADGIDNATALQLKTSLAQTFRDQLATGVPTNADERGLQRLAGQLRSGKVRVRLYLRTQLHAKLYLLFREDPHAPRIGYIGSSNLTMSGLSGQGELNVDVLDHDATEKLSQWFEERWTDRFCVDISTEVAEIIEDSWARETSLRPYKVYLKMAYHLSQEARAGLAEFQVPREVENELADFQSAAVKIAAHHVNKRGGVLIGDVVGLGKTLMATALARMLEDDLGLETLIICPPNLVPMWEDYRERYRLRGRVLSHGRVERELLNLRRYRVIVIDESHNLRNREGRRYRAIHEYIQANESKCILLSATPYNKSYTDLANQLRLFIQEDADLGVRPERLIRELGETEFIRRHQAPVRSLAAFEHSPYPEDWRDLMRLYLVRRTRTFIQSNYASTDDDGREYLELGDGARSYFPKRVPISVPFTIDETDPDDQYARLFRDAVVQTITNLHLPRYGMGAYIKPTAEAAASQAEEKILQDLGRAGQRLKGFSRTNLFKRLESGGMAFLQSIERHLLRNCVFLHALENGLDLPIGPQNVELMDSRINDQDDDLFTPPAAMPDDADGGGNIEQEDIDEELPAGPATRAEEFAARAQELYDDYADRQQRRFRWIGAHFFNDHLTAHLRADADALHEVLQSAGQWNADRDAKLQALYEFLTVTHPNEKVLVFTQFADTVSYLESELTRLGVMGLAGVTGNSDNPTRLAWRFSPVSNQKRQQISPADELRVLIATDVLSEGQNLQDCAIVVNFDLPWAIIRLVQRAGRIDRIGQQAPEILIHSFLPADGVERILRLRARVRQRLRENAEVVGADETFFEDDEDQSILDLYHEKAEVLDAEADSEVDLASYAFQIWKNAIEAEPTLAKTIPEMADVSYTAKSVETGPGGALVYMRTSEDTDALAWIDENGQSVTQSQLEILRAAECQPDTPAVERSDKHHDLVKTAVELIFDEDRSVGGQLGRPSGARFRTYERLKQYSANVSGTLFATRELDAAIDALYRAPLRQTAADILNRQLRSGISNEQLAELAMSLRDEGRLVLEQDERETEEPKIICSLGLLPTGASGA